ncbi:MAG: sigma-E factor regulatory protein RseB domain-containing protein [Armatimonadota bacterium]|nr:sigma-E factor regulatory protein RseB domain-containing protein [Armatimonadota bacterium]
MLLWCAVAVCLAATLVAGRASGQSDPQGLLGGVSLDQFLRHAALAPQFVDYEGTKVVSVLRGATMETVTVSEAHKRPNRTRLEFLSPEAVAGRLVVDDGLQTWQYEPRLHVVIQGPSLAPPVETPPPRLLDRYEASVLALEEVVGRLAVHVRLRPRGAGGERRLWIDRYTGVVLRSEDRDPRDGVVATSYFTRISYGLNFPSAMFLPRIPAGARVLSPVETIGPLMSPDALQRQLGYAVQARAVLPGGFRLQGGEIAVAGVLRVAHLHYHDGIRALGLFVVPARRMGPPGAETPVPTLGATAGVITRGVLHMVQWEAGGMRYALVGPLPVADLVALARAVAPPR